MTQLLRKFKIVLSSVECHSTSQDIRISFSILISTSRINFGLIKIIKNCVLSNSIRSSDLLPIDSFTWGNNLRINTSICFLQIVHFVIIQQLLPYTFYHVRKLKYVFADKSQIDSLFDYLKTTEISNLIWVSFPYGII